MANVPYSLLPPAAPAAGDTVSGLKGVITSKFLVEQLAAAGDLWLKGDITKTVGAGGDFTTLDDAFLWLQEHKDLGSAASSFADKRGIRVTLDLLAGTHLPGGANGYWRLENINFQVAIGASVAGAAAIVGDDSSVLLFTNCSNVRIDDITLKGAVALTHAYLIINWSNYAATCDDAWFQLQRQSAVAGWFDKCRGFYMDGQSNVSVAPNATSTLVIKPRDDFAGEPLYMTEASVMTTYAGVVVDCTTYNGGLANNRGAIHVENAAVLRIDSGPITPGNMAITGGGTFSQDSTHPALKIEGAGNVSCWEPFVITAFAVDSPNHPALIGLDGSVYWDGTTDLQPLIEEVLNTHSLVNQLPAQGVITQITFGGVDANPFFSVDAAGNITAVQAGTYTLRLRVQLGRASGQSGEADIFIIGKIDGIQYGQPIHAKIDNQDIEIPNTFQASATLSVGQVISFDMIVDAAGAAAGGLFADTPTGAAAGWGISPSALVVITRAVI